MIITIIILRPYATCRAQIVTYSLIIGFYYNLVLLIRDSDKRRIIYLFLISLLIVNIHAAVWPFIFILFLPYFVEYILYRFKSKFIFVNSIRFNNINIKILLFAFFICLFAGLITPIGFTPFTYLFNTFRGSTQFYIGEHQPITLWYRKLLLLFLFVLFVVLKNKKMYLSDILLIIGLFIMMLSSQRHSAIFIILSVFIFLKYFDIKVFKYFKINKIEKYKLFKNVVGIVSLIFLVWYPCISINISKINSPLIKDLYPVKAVKFIKDNLNYKDYNIFNDYDIGSYLLFNDIKVMFDSRADLYTKEFNGKYDYFIEFMELGANYEEIFDKYNISYALVYRDSKLYLRLNMNSRYTSIYQDNKVEIFVDNEVLDDILKI